MVRAQAAVVAAGVVIALACFSSTAAASGFYQCQHPATTGETAYNLKHVSSQTACKLVRGLAAWNAQWYQCKGHSSTFAGTPTVTIHKFRGWLLTIRTRPGPTLTMSRGDSSFQVAGTDWPVYCS